MDTGHETVRDVRAQCADCVHARHATASLAVRLRLQGRRYGTIKRALRHTLRLRT